MPFNNGKLNSVRLHGKEVNLSEIGQDFVVKFTQPYGPHVY